MTVAPEPAAIPAPRHRAPEGALPTPLGGPRHRATQDAGPHVRIAAPEERTRPGRHAAPEDTAAEGTAAGGTGEDPLAWLGFRFEPA
jgi:hypothetical protein